MYLPTWKERRTLSASDTGARHGRRLWVHISLQLQGKGKLGLVPQPQAPEALGFWLTEGLEHTSRPEVFRNMVIPFQANRQAVKCLMEKGEGTWPGSPYSAVNPPEARQCGFPKQVNVLICALVEVLYQILLKEERVVGAHRAGAVKEFLVVVAHISLALGWEEFINIHLVTQRHHDDDAEHPRGWGIWLNLLWGDFLNDVPQLPRHLGLEDVKELIRM